MVNGWMDGWVMGKIYWLIVYVLERNGKLVYVNVIIRWQTIMIQTKFYKHDLGAMVWIPYKSYKTILIKSANSLVLRDRVRLLMRVMKYIIWHAKHKSQNINHISCNCSVTWYYCLTKQTYECLSLFHVSFYCHCFYCRPLLWLSSTSYTLPNDISIV